MAYEKHTWEDGKLFINAERLNHIEEGVEKANSVIETVGGDTLTWDGSGNPAFEMGLAMYKVADNIITANDVAQGFIVVFNGQTAELTSDYMTDNGTMIIWDLGVFIYAETNGVEVGVYFSEGISSITIPGYTGFTTEKIKQDALPEALQFGETSSDTLTWDGDVSGLTIAEGFLYKVSDCVPTMSDLQNGVLAVVGNAVEGDRIPLSVENNGIVEQEGCIALMVAEISLIVALIIANDNTTVDGMFIPEKGIYFSNDENALFTKSLTIPGYEFSVINKIDEKYMPAIAQAKSVVLYAACDDAGVLRIYKDNNHTEMATLPDLYVLKMARRRVVIVDGNGMYDAVAVQHSSGTILYYKVAEHSFTIESFIAYTAEYTPTETTSE